MLLAPLVLAAAMFGPHVTNPWFPLKPGRTLVYRGVEGGRPTVDRVRATRTAVIDGVRCRIVDDRLWQGGHLAERTKDYYAQDAAGTVWYLGEDTAELDARGRVTSREGSWRAGRDGAQAGIIMSAHPRVGEQHFQERYPGHAVDQYRVVSRRGNRLRTREWTTLEPGVVDAKFYRRGVGMVREASQKGPVERSTLVAIEG